MQRTYNGSSETQAQPKSVCLCVCVYVFLYLLYTEYQNYHSVEFFKGMKTFILVLKTLNGCLKVKTWFEVWSYNLV